MGLRVTHKGFLYTPFVSRRLTGYCQVVILAVGTRFSGVEAGEETSKKSECMNCPQETTLPLS